MTVKLTFPNGEHEPVTLGEGVTSIGTSSSCHVVLTAPGISPHHAEIAVHGGDATLRVLEPRGVVVLNGRQIVQDTSVKVGDLVLFAKVGCQITAAAPVAPRRVADLPSGMGADDGRTRVRQTLPKYILRGVSGPTFGKAHAITGTMVIGRQADCDIPVPTEEISRQHVRLQASAEGVLVEDLGSANGTFINDKRVRSGVLRPGEELRLDTVRFLLITPGAEPSKPVATPALAPEPRSNKSRLGLVMAVVVTLAVSAIAVAKYVGLF